MQKPSLTKNALFEQFLQPLAPELQQMAIEFKAFTFGRKIRTVEQLLQAVLLYCGLDHSFRETAALLTLQREKITDTAVRERLLACGPWLKACIKYLLRIPSTLFENKGYRFKLIDGSLIQTPVHQPNYRLHLCINLETLTAVELVLDTEKKGESLLHFNFEKNDVAIVDRGYFYFSHLQQVVAQGAHVVARYRPNAGQVYNPHILDCQEELDLVKVLKKHERVGECSIAVELRTRQKKQGMVRGWLHAVRLPAEKRAISRRKQNRKAKKNDWTVTKRTAYMAGWCIVFTTLPAEQFSRSTLLELYRCRWQIELVFKRLKSILKLSMLRVKQVGPMADVWLHGKLFYAVLLQRKAGMMFSKSPFDLRRERELTPWRAIKIANELLRNTLHNPACWKKENYASAFAVLKERKRKRTLQTLPLFLRTPKLSIESLAPSFLQEVA